MNETIIARATRARDVGPLYGPNTRYRVTADAKLYSLGNQAPYFSVTGEELNLRRRGDDQLVACGCLHDMIVKYWPELEPVIKVHLADEHGVPMHAVANALYWFGFTKYPPDNDYGRRVLATDANGIVWAPSASADHLRVTVEEACAIREALVYEQGNRTMRMEEIVRSDLAARWQADADAAMAVLTAVQ